MNFEIDGICSAVGCSNTVEWNSDYCDECGTGTANESRKTCLAPGCHNTAAFNDNLLCMVCSHYLETARKEKSRTESIDAHEQISLRKQCETPGCTDNAIFMNKCNSCIEELLRSSRRQSETPINTDERTTDDNSTDDSNRQSKVLATNELEADTTCNTILTIPNNVKSVVAATSYGNVDLATERRKRTTLCYTLGCSRPVELDSRYCAFHSKMVTAVICATPSCGNHTEDDDDILCRVCAHEEQSNEIFGSSSRRPCAVRGCINTAEEIDNWLCMVCHQERKQAAENFDLRRQTKNRNTCILLGCSNPAEPGENYLCMVCAREQRIAIEQFESKRSAHPGRPGCPTPITKPLPLPSRLGIVKSTASGQSTNANFDLKTLAMSLPRIPGPTAHKSNQDLSTQNKSNGIEVLARGFSNTESVDKTVSGSPISLCNLPPIPLPFNRSNSMPGTSNPPLIIHHFNADLISSRTPSLPNSIQLDSLCRSISVDGTVPSILPRNDDLLNTYPVKEICKTEGCKFFVNEGLGGYCSECFMCCNISENIPPARSSFDMYELDEYTDDAMSQRFENQICKSGDCEFFGNDDFDGYCSGCYRHRPLKSTAQIALPHGDNDDKLCIICLQNVYNTVLLPCGHLYLCYECADTIKRKGKTCPACRSHIQSFHRVYTPD